MPQLDMGNTKYGDLIDSLSVCIEAAFLAIGYATVMYKVVNKNRHEGIRESSFSRIDSGGGDSSFFLRVFTQLFFRVFVALPSVVILSYIVWAVIGVLMLLFITFNHSVEMSSGAPALRPVLLGWQFDLGWIVSIFPVGNYIFLTFFLIFGLYFVLVLYTWMVIFTLKLSRLLYYRRNHNPIGSELRSS